MALGLGAQVSNPRGQRGEAQDFCVNRVVTHTILAKNTHNRHSDEICLSEANRGCRFSGAQQSCK